MQIIVVGISVELHNMSNTNFGFCECSMYVCNLHAFVSIMLEMFVVALVMWFVCRHCIISY